MITAYFRRSLSLLHRAPRRSRKRKEEGKMPRNLAADAGGAGARGCRARGRVGARGGRRELVLLRESAHRHGAHIGLTKQTSRMLPDVVIGGMQGCIFHAQS